MIVLFTLPIFIPHTSVNMFLNAIATRNNGFKIPNTTFVEGKYS